MSAARILTVAGLVSGILQVLLGLLIWFGLSTPWLSIHIPNGLLFSVLLLVVAILGLRARLPRGKPILALAWAVLLPAFGMAQAAILPGGAHWIMQVLHLAVGLVGIGLLRTIGDALHERSQDKGRLGKA
jgi:hypothetical protein